MFKFNKLLFILLSVFTFSASAQSNGSDLNNYPGIITSDFLSHSFTGSLNNSDFLSQSFTGNVNNSDFLSQSYTGNVNNSDFLSQSFQFTKPLQPGFAPSSINYNGLDIDKGFAILTPKQKAEDESRKNLPFVKGDTCESEYLAACQNDWVKKTKDPKYTKEDIYQLASKLKLNHDACKKFKEQSEIKCKDKIISKPQGTNNKLTCEWKPGFFPRKVTGSNSCGRGSKAATLCVGYVVCGEGEEQRERLATCGPENCQTDKATECARQGGYFSKAITKEDKTWRTTPSEASIATPIAIGNQ